MGPEHEASGRQESAGEEEKVSWGREAWGKEEALETSSLPLSNYGVFVRQAGWGAWERKGFLFLEDFKKKRGDCLSNYLSGQVSFPLESKRP